MFSHNVGMSLTHEPLTAYNFGALPPHWGVFPVTAGVTNVYMTFFHPFPQIPKTSFAYCSIVLSVLSRYDLDSESIQFYHFKLKEHFLTGHYTHSSF